MAVCLIKLVQDRSEGASRTGVGGDHTLGLNKGPTPLLTIAAAVSLLQQSQVIARDWGMVLMVPEAVRVAQALLDALDRLERSKVQVDGLVAKSQQLEMELLEHTRAAEQLGVMQQALQASESQQNQAIQHLEEALSEREVAVQALQARESQRDQAIHQIVHHHKKGSITLDESLSRCPGHPQTSSWHPLGHSPNHMLPTPGPQFHKRQSHFPVSTRFPPAIVHKFLAGPK